MTVPVVVRGRVLCVFSLALLCVSVSATAAEQAVAVEAAEANVVTARKAKEAAITVAKDAKLAVEKANTTKVMAGVAVLYTNRFMKLFEEAKTIFQKASTFAETAKKIGENKENEVRAQNERVTARCEKFRIQVEEAAKKADAAVMKAALAGKYVYTASLVARWAAGNGTEAERLLKDGAVNSAKDAVEEANKAAIHGLLAAGNAQGAVRWIKVTAQAARWAEARAEARADRNGNTIGEKLLKAATDAVMYAQRAMTNITEAKKQADVMLQAAKKAADAATKFDQEAKAARTAAEDEITAAEKRLNEAEEMLKDAQQQEKEAIEDQKRKQEAEVLRQMEELKKTTEDTERLKKLTLDDHANSAGVVNTSVNGEENSSERSAPVVGTLDDPVVDVKENGMDAPITLPHDPAAEPPTQEIQRDSHVNNPAGSQQNDILPMDHHIEEEPSKTAAHDESPSHPVALEAPSAVDEAPHSAKPEQNEIPATTVDSNTGSETDTTNTFTVSAHDHNATESSEETSVSDTNTPDINRPAVDITAPDTNQSPSVPSEEKTAVESLENAASQAADAPLTPPNSDVHNTLQDIRSMDSSVSPSWVRTPLLLVVGVLGLLAVC
ncbi:hypothetical protein DQ04_07231020 [Trypanosoma grayi]|uniref:hypothetical protein n=1 Tax=Trypanosoma grayi TaxID=71804 RepID=UPI0004F40CCD|nr:hypothetical protein DQ04_07231020 [Trypanosoma grayi]KEG08417.1 hypothetical protein DQ04_07231020 [Trypanosoma grayi]